MKIGRITGTKPSQSAEGGDFFVSLCLLAIPAFDRIAGLCNRHLNCKWGIAYANDLKNNRDEIAGVFIREKFWFENIMN